MQSPAPQCPYPSLSTHHYGYLWYFLIRFICCNNQSCFTERIDQELSKNVNFFLTLLPVFVPLQCLFSLLAISGALRQILVLQKNVGLLNTYIKTSNFVFPTKCLYHLQCMFPFWSSKVRFSKQSCCKSTEIVMETTKQTKHSLNERKFLCERGEKVLCTSYQNLARSTNFLLVYFKNDNAILI